ncbi:MAG: pyridoxal phosphate-dependent aminotransferase [Verrucomicrobiae bacterium]|nr:pyridoxal phosphate-dependent aminotransferase [Verrucomicrobiae bacterium]
MRPRISKKLEELLCTKSPVREIMDLASPEFFKRVGLDPVQVISFSGGWVNHDSPAELRQAYAEIALDPRRFHASGAYSPTIGTPECRAAIAEYEKHLFGHDMQLGPENIAIGANSTQLTLSLMQLILSPGEKLLLPDPAYCNYPAQAAAVGGVQIVRFPLLDPVQWRYVADERADEFARFILAEKPKMILLCAPDNPTSQVPSTRFVKAALDAAVEVGALLVIDFAYKEIVWGARYPEYFGWGPTDNFVTIHSNSKWCRGLGRRLGWIQAPPEIIEALEAAQAANILCPDTLHQMALADYIRRGIAADSIKPYVMQMIARYEAVARFTVEAVHKHLGVPCIEPQGGLYTVVRVGMDSSEFARRALENAGVVVVPGWGFGDTLKHGVRLSYGPLVNDLEKIDLGVRRLSRVLAAR